MLVLQPKLRMALMEGAKVERPEAVLEMLMGRAMAQVELLMLQVAQTLRVKLVLELREMLHHHLVVVALLGREEIQMQPLIKKISAHQICLTNLPRNFVHR
jgi:hypothetical protein